MVSCGCAGSREQGVNNSVAGAVGLKRCEQHDTPPLFFKYNGTKFFYIILLLLVHGVFFILAPQLLRVSLWSYVLHFLNKSCCFLCTHVSPALLVAASTGRKNKERERGREREGERERESTKQKKDEEKRGEFE